MVVSLAMVTDYIQILSLANQQVIGDIRASMPKVHWTFGKIGLSLQPFNDCVGIICTGCVCLKKVPFFDHFR